MALDPQQNLIIKVNDHKGGGAGQIVLDDVSFSGTRDNSIYHGIGNQSPQDISPGNEEYSMDVTSIASEQALSMLRTVKDRGNVDTAEVRSVDDQGNTVDRVTIGEFVWNDFEYSATDGGDYTLSITADCLDVSFGNQ